MKETNMPKADFVTSIILSICSISIIVISIRMPRMEEVGADPYSAPGIVPGFLGVLIFILSMILFVRSLLRKGHALDVNGESISAFFKDRAVIRVLLTILLSVFYGAVLLGKMPYVPVTFLYVMAFVLIFEYRFDRKFHVQKKTVLFSTIQALLTSGIVATVFRYVFLVKLP